ncbi:MAG: hypothetical protein ACKVZ0_24125 [Gemmatimonadales bacterium]
MRFLAPAAFILGSLAAPAAAAAQSDSLPPYLRHRGSGQPTSMFGTTIARGQLLIYPFFEYYRDHNYEYEPADLGYGLTQEFRGRYRASEGLLFLGYGITDWLAIEIEAAHISARLDKDPADPTGLPARIKASGVGDIEGQLRLRWLAETARRPMVFSYFEAVAPRQRGQPLIATPDWEFKFGTGVSRGFGWGALTARVAIQYDASERKVGPGEYAVEFVRRLAPWSRLYLGIEGTEDEVEQITELQLTLLRGLTIKLNNAVGLTSKATDWAPEVGILFSIPIDR